MKELLSKEILKVLYNPKELSKETFAKESAELMKPANPLEFSLDTIKNQSLESLKIENKITIENNNAIQKEKSLSDEEKQKIKNDAGWSDEMIKEIGSMEEYIIYKQAGLQEAEINGKKCLIRSDIDWDQKDSMGRTNRERVEAGLSPINIHGEIIELHHIGQKNEGYFAELTPDEHRGKENFSILHDIKNESEIDQNKFAVERSEHWKQRCKMTQEGGSNV